MSTQSSSHILDGRKYFLGHRLPPPYRNLGEGGGKGRRNRECEK